MCVCTGIGVGLCTAKSCIKAAARLRPHQKLFLFPVAKVEEGKVRGSVQNFLLGLQVLAMVTTQVDLSSRHWKTVWQTQFRSYWRHCSFNKTSEELVGCFTSCKHLNSVLGKVWMSRSAHQNMCYLFETNVDCSHGPQVDTSHDFFPLRFSLQFWYRWKEGNNSGITLTCSAMHAHFGGLGHRGDGMHDHSR